MDWEEFKEKAADMCQFQKTDYQHFVAQYVSRYSPHRGLLVYHGLGSGKLCSAITIAEGFLKHHRMYEETDIWIISKKALKKSFENEVFKVASLLTPEFMRDQCTGDQYYKLIPEHKTLSVDKLTQRIVKLIKSRYKFFGYETFANRVQEWIDDGTLPDKAKNKIIIIDEAHNIRNGTEGDKKIIEPFLQCIEHGENNRLVLLTATPMYNEAEEMLWLLSLLCLNEGNDRLSPYRLPKLNEETYSLVGELSSHYVSYVKGGNPFTFPLRVTPKMLNLPTLKEKWTQYIADGIVPSVLSGLQLEYVKQASKDKHATALSRQLNNIAYTKKLTKEAATYTEGKDGVYSVFTKRGDVFQLEYLDPKQPILDPAFGQLQHHATKLYTLSQLLVGSKGLVVIYSNFIWGGLIPLAVLLEHMGMKRVGEKNVLAAGVVGRGSSGGELNGKEYCILAGDAELMGESKIDKLLEEINQEGSRIKVVLMSPVAGEGLSFKNVREMHILDPWYHMNAVEQAIGRAIRNCSHSRLELEDRNVSVFLHATVYPTGSKETEDIRAYHIAADKQAEILKLDKVIRENAIDCGMYDMPSVEGLSLGIRTSRGSVIMWALSDGEQVTCRKRQDVGEKKVPLRLETYEALIPTLQQKLRKYLKKRIGVQTSYGYDELLEVIHREREVSKMVLQASLYPYVLWDEYALYDHNNLFYVLPVKASYLHPAPVRLLIEDIQPVVPRVECDLLKVWEGYALEPEGEMILHVYMTLDSVCWKAVAEDLILHPEKRSKAVEPILRALEKQGALFLGRDGSGVVGYVNVFSEEDTYALTVYEAGIFREATQREIQKMVQRMRKVPFPDPSKTSIVNTLGFFQRYRNPKEPTSPYRFLFKLGLNNEKGKRSGVVCDSGMKKPDIEKELASFMPLVDPMGQKLKINISQMCSRLMVELYNSGRFWLPPMYKP